MPDVNENDKFVIDKLRIGLATAKDMGPRLFEDEKDNDGNLLHDDKGRVKRRYLGGWSYGEVTKPETINYRTLRPEKDGLFSEQIFGPTRDWECACGKYKHAQYKGTICERCHVEVTRSRVRRERMGHINLAAPVTHIWFFKGVPSRLGYLLDISPKDLEKVIYFAAYMVTSVDEKKRHDALPDLQGEHERSLSRLEKGRDNEINRRERKLEEDLAALEADGEVKPAIKTRLRNAADRDAKAIRAEWEKRIDRENAIWARFIELKPGDMESDVDLWHELQERYHDYFDGCMGAEAIKRRLEDFDLEGTAAELREVVKAGSNQKTAKALKRLKVINAFIKTGTSPTAMVLDVVPVIPPDLRPMVQLDGGRFATSDLNDLYRRVINRNNRLKRLIELNAPEIMLNNEKRMLQEAVDSLFDNGRRGRAVTGASNRPLKSLSDMLKGKQGRFRQNLLGKRVDYSGRSVIVVGPTLRMHQCGLPKPMALELFKPFVIKRLVELEYESDIKGASHMIDRGDPRVWDALEDVINEHPVLLNRAPTLHRLGIQAFEPILVEGKAIHLPPLACAAFNADFDGDQMAVHLPLSVKAQAEARSLMMASDNILKPADGHTVTMPSQDMILGLYFLTTVKENAKGQGRVFGSLEEARMALDLGEIDIQGKILLRMPADFVLPTGWEPGDVPVYDENAQPATYTDEDGKAVPAIAHEERFADGTILFATSYGRVLFNGTLPVDYPFINEQVPKGKLSGIVDDIAARYSTAQVAATLDALKDLGFTRAQWSGVTMAFSDIVAPPEHKQLADEYEKRADDVNEQLDMGLITEAERRQELIDLWTECTDKVAKAMEDNFTADNNVNIMVTSGARGNWMQIRQIAGMRGLVANPKGEIIPRPVKSNYRDGLSVLEYFISQHGARKGLADTALRTAESGYLTRRLVDVSQDVIVREEDCGTRRGLELRVGDRIPLLDDAGNPVTDAKGDPLYEVMRDEEGEELADKDGNPVYKLTLVKNADGGPYSRILAADVTDPATGETLMARGDALSMAALGTLVEHGVETVKARSVLTCESKHGVCSMCYGWSLATNQLVDIGEAVGIVAAQSIGEPGTQLTLRSFHNAGAADAADITQGLPRVVELFEARTPKGEAPIAEFPGTVTVNDEGTGSRVIILTPDDATAHDGKPIEYKVARRPKLLVSNGQHVAEGTQLVEGSVDPKKILNILGPRAATISIVDGVHDVYRSQGVDIHDKHIEVIVRQMIRRDSVLDSGDSDLLPGDLVDHATFIETSRALAKAGRKPAQARPVLMGITKASLATDSWLSAASFQETTRVLTEAALNEKVDDLKGLKENVIIGKLIPAGTGLARYRSVTVKPDPAVSASVYGVGMGSMTDPFSATPDQLGDVELSNSEYGSLSFSSVPAPDLTDIPDDESTDDMLSNLVSTDSMGGDDMSLLGQFGDDAEDAAIDLSPQEGDDAADDALGLQADDGQDGPLSGGDEPGAIGDPDGAEDDGADGLGTIDLSDSDDDVE